MLFFIGVSSPWLMPDCLILPCMVFAEQCSQDWSGIRLSPTAVRSGLSVQVNGFFEVSSNRRGIWYGDDMDISGKVHFN
ncbi:hypothetical protein Lalb_Chr01g0013021 [Lupinus albus]|uniref:Uncharacterized protein n=1 Tax=Lupinus albus TaxID=3870 RepID=A0A6A4R886_LUPAL|nr:hypothetical protein Lalb_Chr01g0013021 [Lupinus albus]